jgi:prefoldin subunit 5
MSNTILETTHKPTWLDDHTTGFGYGYSNDMTTKKEAIKRIDKFEYKKTALLNYRNDLMNKLAKCADEISEIDYEMRTINLELMEKMKNDRR